MAKVKKLLFMVLSINIFQAEAVVDMRSRMSGWLIICTISSDKIGVGFNWLVKKPIACSLLRQDPPTPFCQG
jgi:hypothetical protein